MVRPSSRRKPPYARRSTRNATARRMRVSTRTRPSLRARACLDRREDARRRLSGAGFSQARCKLNPRKCIQRGAGRSRCTYLRDGLFEGTEGGAIVLHNLWVRKARVRGRQHPAWSRSRVDARMRSAEKTWQRQARAAMPGKRRRRRRRRRAQSARRVCPPAGCLLFRADRARDAHRRREDARDVFH